MKIIMIENKAIQFRFHFNSLLWLIKAAGKDKIRDNLYQIVHVEQDIYYCTDGHRLHVYSPNTDDLPQEICLVNGDYKIKIVNKKYIIFEKVELQYININYILSYQPTRTERNIMFLKFTNFIYKVYHDWNAMINIDYLHDAFITMEGEKIIIEKPDNNDKSFFVFGNENRIAIIMPLHQ